MKKIKLFLMLLITLCISNSLVKAEELYANEYNNLDEAIEKANDGDIIVLQKDEMVTKAFNKSLTFKGNYMITFSGMLDNTGERQWHYTGEVAFDGTSFIWDSTDWDNTGRFVMLVLTGKLKLTNGSVGTLKFDSNNGVNCAIYSNSGASIEIDNGSTLNIFGNNTKGVSGQGIQLDSTNGTGIFVRGGSTLLIDGTNRGYVNSPNVVVENSTLIIRNCTSNATNGGNFTAMNSNISITNNNGHGLSSTNLMISDGSVVNTSGNSYAGIIVGSNLEIKSSTVTINNNGCNKASKWTLPGALVLSGGYGIISEDVNLEIKGNNGPGISNRNGKLEVYSGLITENYAKTFIDADTGFNFIGYGGGIHNLKDITIGDNVVIYNNKATEAGDDIYNSGNATISFGSVRDGLSLKNVREYDNLVLNDCSDRINGWYDDSENARWNAHDNNLEHIELINSGNIEGLLFIKAAHDKLKGTLVINHVDEETNERLTEEEVSTDLVGNSYTTSPRDFMGYEYSYVDGEEVGEYIDGIIYVTYYYTKTIGSGDIEVMPPQTGVEVSTNYNNIVYYRKKEDYLKI